MPGILRAGPGRGQERSFQVQARDNALVGQAGLLFILIMAILIFGTHHANIRRLLAGEEHRIGA